MLRNKVLMVLSIMPLSVGGVSGAPAPKSFAPCLADLSGITDAVEGWEASRSIRVTPSVRHVVIGDFCKSMVEIQAQRSMPDSAFEDVADPTIVEFLDRSANLDLPDVSMEAILQKHLGYHGFAVPKPKRWGILKISYRQAVDQMKISGEIFEPFDRYLLELGSHTVTGLRQLNMVCTGSVEVKSSKPTNFEC